MLAEEKYRVLPGASEKEPPPVELEFPEVMDGVAGQFAEVTCPRLMYHF